MDKRSTSEELMALEILTLKQQVNVLTVELSLIHEWIQKTTGISAVNTDSGYYKCVHVPSLEMKAIRKSLQNGNQMEYENEAWTTGGSGSGNQECQNSEPNSCENFHNELTTLVEDVEDDLPPVLERQEPIDITDGDDIASLDWDPPMPTLERQVNLNELEYICNSEDGKTNDETNAAAGVGKGHPVELPQLTRAYVRITNTDQEPVLAHMKLRVLPLNKSRMGRTGPKDGRSRGGRNESNEPDAAGHKSHRRKHSTGSSPWRHTVDKPHTCQYCKKTFANKQGKTVHERIHTGEKPYNCEYCGKAFRHIGSLTAHHRIHTKEKPYICSICHQSFAHSGTLRQHQTRHEASPKFNNTYLNI